MATEVPATAVAAVTGLESFQRLNAKTYLYTPSAGTAPAKDQPSLILVASWMNAGPRHIAKYTAYYQSLYPLTPILLIRSSTADFFLNSAAKQASDLRTAVSVIREHVPDASHRLLVHALSNGGAGQVAFLAKVYSDIVGAPLPARILVMDSTPGKSHVVRGVNAFTQGMSSAWYVKLPFMAIFGVLITLFFVVPEWFGKKNLANVMRDNLNSLEPELVSRKAKRCYIYSDADALILDRDIEDHAKDAEKRGFCVEMVKFTGTPHVAHMRSDPVRYWANVQKVWEASI